MDAPDVRWILGVKIHAVDVKKTLSIIESFIRDGRPRMVVTADSSAVVLANRDAELLRIINAAHLVTPDSVGILWAAKRFRTPLPERVSGADIFELICKKAAHAGYRIFLLGALPGVADEAAHSLRKRYPGIDIVGTHHGYFSEADSDYIVDLVRRSRPHILFVAMGIPAQEKWIYRHLEELQVPVAMGVGGTFDVVSGRVRRAPQFMRRWGLEWCFRLMCNPRKIKKCLTLPVFVLMVLRATCRIGAKQPYGE